MPGFKFIHAADIHLDSPLRGLERYEGAPLDEIRGATRRALENLIDLAIEEEVTFVLLAGDLYDGDWKDYNTGLFFIRQLARLQEQGIRVFLISGNHDAASQIAKNLHLPDNTHLFSHRRSETREMAEFEVAVHGQSFARRDIQANLAENYPDAIQDHFNIGLLHTSLNGREGHDPYAPCSEDDLRDKGYQYWALGHVHKREIVSEDPWIVFPGNVQGRHARETGAKGCTLVTVDEGEVIEVEHRDLNVLRWDDCNIDVSGADSQEDVYGAIREGLTESLSEADGRLLAARIRLTGACKLDQWLRTNQKKLANECRSISMQVALDDIWIEKVRVETRAQEDETEALTREDALGQLLRTIRDLELDDSKLEELAKDFDQLANKLPTISKDQISPASLEGLKSSLPDVKALLMQKLLEHGSES